MAKKLSIEEIKEMKSGSVITSNGVDWLITINNEEKESITMIQIQNEEETASIGYHLFKMLYSNGIPYKE